MDTNRERCPVCDRGIATASKYAAWRDDPARPVGEEPPDDECYGWVRIGERACQARAVNWRTRALQAEDRIRWAVEVLNRSGVYRVRDCDCALCNAIAILTREVQP